jgi:ankyrin repeat protein
LSRSILSKSRWLSFVVLAACALPLPAAAQSYSDGHKFLEAVEKKKSEEVTDMLAATGGSVLINSRDLASNRTALHIVVQRRDETWLNWLLRRGANPNISDNKGVSPLLLACRLGFIPGVEALVKATAGVDEPSSAGETPLIYAVHSRNIPLMRVLLEAGANPDRADNSGRTARDYAKLDQGTLLAEIERNAKNTRTASSRNYGPSL